ncbi:MAG: cytochrome c oxidase accessory protein CcoG [Sphingomonadaceae bacterium]|nr:cytochrome c oxidase accessory protein CcoG [Sphingomonadaceae bacterium]
MNSPDPVGAGVPDEFYEKRTSVHPKRIDGRYRRIKWAAMLITLAIYYITPWIRWDRGPHVTNQAVLVDFAHRRFYMFGIEIWPHEFYFVAGMLIMAGFGLFLVTSAVGRAWCGYSCPQTVWTDLFQHVDRFVDGDRNARMRLDAAPWTGSKIARRLFKWTIYLVISFWTGGAWIMYFSDAPTLVRDFWSGQAAPIAYGTIAVLTLTTFTFGGIIREQVCIYMCPWPRIQTALMDENSLQVTYKDWRGEPRGSVKKAKKNPADFGDCVDCNQCVAVCPTGWDIRKGPDISCITCALCIDACDRVMADVGRPRGLISYATLDDCKAEQAGGAPRPAWKALTRPRIVVYFAAWSAIGLALLFALGTRSHTDISAASDRNPPFMLMSDGSIRNAFTVKLRNMQSSPRTMRVKMQGLPGGAMWTDEMDRKSATRAIESLVPADETKALRIYVMAPPDTSSQDFALVATAQDREGEQDRTEQRFNGPDNSR